MSTEIWVKIVRPDVIPDPHKEEAYRLLASDIRRLALNGRRDDDGTTVEIYEAKVPIRMRRLRKSGGW